MTPIVPAIIPASAEDIKTTLLALSFAREVQIDVVDGKFVPFTSWPFDPLGEPEEVRSFTDEFTLEVDLMVEDQIRAAHDWIKAGADMLVFHIESVDLLELKTFAEGTSISIGVSSTNNTPLEDLLSYMGVADYVQLMGIGEIGSQGQSFDERVLGRIGEIKKNFPKHMISIDGSVNKDTIRRLKEAGADRFVSGSAILKASDPKKAYEELCSMVA